MKYQYLIKKPATVEKQGGVQRCPFKNNRPEFVAQRKLIEGINKSLNVAQCRLKINNIQYTTIDSIKVALINSEGRWDNRWEHYINLMIEAGKQISYSSFKNLVSNLYTQIFTRYKRMIRIETGYWEPFWDKQIEKILLNIRHEPSLEEILKLLFYSPKLYDQDYPSKNLIKKGITRLGQVYGELEDSSYKNYFNYKNALERKSLNIDTLREQYVNSLSLVEKKNLKQSYEASSKKSMDDQKERQLYNGEGSDGYLYHGVSLQEGAYAIQVSGYLLPAKSKFRGYSDPSMDGLLSFTPSLSGATPGIIFRVKVTPANISKWDFKKVSVDEVRTVYPIPINNLEWTNDCKTWYYIQDRPIPNPAIQKISLYVPSTSKIHKKG